MKHVYVTLIVPLCVLIPLMAGFRNRAYTDRALTFIFYYLLFVALIAIPLRLLGSRNINTLPLLHSYTIIEFMMISCFFVKVLDRFYKNYIVGTAFIFSVACIINAIYIQNPFSYNSYSRPVAAGIIILYCMLYFLAESKQSTETHIMKHSRSWIVTGLLIYFCSSIFYFAFLNLLNSSTKPDLYFLMGKIHASLVLIMYILFSQGFLLYKYER